MVFILKTRPDRIGTEILSFLFQFYFCYKNNYFLHLNYNSIKFKDSIFMKCILKIINDYNNNLLRSGIPINKSIDNDIINIPGPGETDMCYGMGMIVQILGVDMLTFFKTKFYESIKQFFEFETKNNYNIPFDPENTIVIHLRLDDQWWESDYDSRICSNHYSNLINNNEKCYFTNGPNNKFNKQNPLSSEKIKTQLNILLQEFPHSKVVIIASPLTKIPELNFNYDIVLQNNDFNYDLFLLSKSKKIILSRSNFSLISLFFGEQTHVHMPLWGHFACAGFGTKYDNCKFTYFY